MLQDRPKAMTLAQSLKQLAPQQVADALKSESRQQLPPELARLQNQAKADSTQDAIEFSTQDTLDYLEILLRHHNPLVQACALFLIAQLNPGFQRSIRPMCICLTVISFTAPTAKRCGLLPFPSMLSMICSSRC